MPSRRPPAAARLPIVDLRGAAALTGPEAQDLDALLERTGAPLTARLPWLRAWFDHAPGKEPWLIGVREGEVLRAGVLLAHSRRRRSHEVVGAGAGPSDELRLAAEPGSAAALAWAMDVALARTPGSWSLRIEQLPARDPVVEAFLLRRGLRRVVPGDGLPRVELPTPQSVPSSRNSRQADRRAARQLEAAGPLRCTWWRSADDVARWLPDVQRVHLERDLDARGRSDHHDASVRGFYRQVVLEHATRGLVHLLTVQVGDDLAAYVLGFRDRDVLRVWDNRVSPRWRSASAGRYANGLALRYVAEQPDLTVLDWMRGEEPYKLASATHVDPAVHLLAWSSPAAAVPWAARRAVRTALHSSPRLMSAAANLQGAWSRQREA